MLDLEFNLLVVTWLMTVHVVIIWGLDFHWLQPKQMTRMVIRLCEVHFQANGLSCHMSNFQQVFILICFSSFT